MIADRYDNPERRVEDFYKNLDSYCQFLATLGLEEFAHAEQFMRHFNQFLEGNLKMVTS